MTPSATQQRQIRAAQASQLPGDGEPAGCPSTEPVCRSWWEGAVCRQLTLLLVCGSTRSERALRDGNTSENSLGGSRYDGKIGFAETVLSRLRWKGRSLKRLCNTTKPSKLEVQYAARLPVNDKLEAATHRLCSDGRQEIQFSLIHAVDSYNISQSNSLSFCLSHVLIRAARLAWLMRAQSA